MTNARINELKASIAAAGSQVVEFGDIRQLVALIDQLQSDLLTSRNQIATLNRQLNSSTTRASLRR